MHNNTCRLFARSLAKSTLKPKLNRQQHLISLKSHIDNGTNNSSTHPLLPSRFSSRTQLNQTINTRDPNAIESQQRKIKKVATATFDAQQRAPGVEQFETFFCVGEVGGCDEEEEEEGGGDGEVCSGVFFLFH